MLKKVFTYLILSLTIFTNSQSFVFSQIYNGTKTEISADGKNTSFYIFPDSWSKEKIKKEIGEAYINKKYDHTKKDGITKVYNGLSSTGQKYEIIEKNGSFDTIYGTFN